MEKRATRYSKNAKKSFLHVNQESNEVQKLILTKKNAYFERNLTENIYKPKQLWKSGESLGLKFESSVSNINCCENNRSTNFDVKDIVEAFSVYFSNLTENPLSKLPDPWEVFFLTLGNSGKIFKGCC